MSLLFSHCGTTCRWIVLWRGIVGGNNCPKQSVLLIIPDRIPDRSEERSIRGRCLSSMATPAKAAEACPAERWINSGKMDHNAKAFVVAKLDMISGQCKMEKGVSH
jgi:hypothetical protein